MKDNVLEIITEGIQQRDSLIRPDTPRPPPPVGSAPPPSPSPVENERLSSFTKDIIKTNYNDHWVICSSKVDRRAVQFFSQTLIIVGVMCVCIVHLGHNQSCETTQMWMGLLTLLLGVLIPSPKFSK